MSNNFRQRLKSGETLLGTMVTLPTAATAEILADIEVLCDRSEWDCMKDLMPEENTMHSSVL